MAEFQGFGPGALAFLKALGFHQNRDWFEANRGVYEAELVQPMRALIETLDRSCRASGLPFSGDPKRSMFRIHRDIRFSKNKDPYKTNAGFTLGEGGTKTPHGIFYFHLDPAGSFLAAGSYMPEPDKLLRFRRAIAANPARFLQIVETLAKAGLQLDDEHRLSRPPAGFRSADSLIMEHLKRKSFTVTRPLTEDILTRPKELAGACQDFMRDSLPLTEFVRAVG